MTKTIYKKCGSADVEETAWVRVNGGDVVHGDINNRKEIVTAVYERRRDRASHPEGRFDGAGRWYPTDREDCGGSGTSARAPSRAYPYSYMGRCRTRKHCAALVDAALNGDDVPADVRHTVEQLSSDF